MVERFLRDTMKVVIANWNIDYVTTLRRGREQSILVIFTPFSKKLEVMEHGSHFVGT
jgi:hypothetical protein